MSIRRVAAAITVTVLLATGCSSGHTNVEVDAGAASTAPGIALSPAVDHVHGAVVVDGALLIGTHTGLVEVDPATGTTARRGESKDDLMGLASDGTTLFASGHPGEGSSLPDPMGLLRSDDGGTTWQPVSLTGEVDFHGLVASGERVAGLGTEDGLMLSVDAGRTWEVVDAPGAGSLAWFDDALWIATTDGLRIWKDGTVEPVTADVRPIALASADDGSALWAVQGDGTVWRTTDGSAWSRHGTITALEGLAATRTTAYAVTAESVTVIPAD